MNGLHQFLTYGDLLLINVRDGRRDVPVKITKVNPRNYICVDEGGLTYNVDRLTARPAPEGTIFKEAEAPSLHMGDTVLWDSKPGLWVVVGKKADGLQIAKVNGNSDQYFYRIQPNRLTKVDVVVK
jgi:hypothetical protein